MTSARSQLTNILVDKENMVTGKQASSQKGSRPSTFFFFVLGAWN